MNTPITVGIIANPASGKDIRRLVAHGSVFDNEEKVNIVRRVLCGLESVGVQQVYFMPESYGIGPRALDGLKSQMQVEYASMTAVYRQQDSMVAGARMKELGVGCIVSLGGDGTNRMIAKGCGDVPIMPVSTGTNNVFPLMIEGTIAGMAAGLVARGVSLDAARTVPRVDVFLAQNSQQADDLALVDAVVYAERFIGSRAIWDTTKLRELVLTRVQPGNIGLSSIGSHLVAGVIPADHGLFVRVGEGGRPIFAPIAPGLMASVSILEHTPLAPQQEVTIRHKEPCVVALDGEREHEIPPNSAIRFRLNPHGPRVVDPRLAIELAAKSGFFLG